MSMRSFDKFCEKLILGEPASQKEILDERQKIARMRCGIEALIAFAALSAANSVIMDNVYKWSESYTAPMLVLFMICLIYYNFRCFFKECLIGVNGTFSAKFASFYSLFMSGFMLLKILPSEEEKTVFFSDGIATDDFLLLICAALFLIFGISDLILIKIFTRSRKDDE